MDDLKAALAREREYIVRLRRDFHRRPELGLREFRTADRIEEELDSFGVSHTRVGATGVLGTLRGAGAGDGVVVLRADIDALPIQETHDTPYRSTVPGVMHACGHDAHTACLLGAAKYLAARREAFGGEIRLIFQPAEEIGQGAKLFVEAGALAGAGRVFGIHTAYDLPAGSVGVKAGLNNAAVDHFRISIRGRSAHVAAPELGVDALYIASQTVVAVQALVTRRTSPVEPIVIGVGKLTAGTAYNALADSAVMEGTTRTVSQESRERIRSLVSETAGHIAGIYGGEAELAWTDLAAPLINDRQACGEAAAVTEALCGADKVVTDRELSLSGDDFAEYLLHVPGVYVYLGTGNPALPNTTVCNHNGAFDIDEDVLTTGAGLYAGYALSRLTPRK